MTVDELIQAWQVNNQVNLDVLALCPDDTFDLKPGKGKTIRSNFVHIIGVRRHWVEEKLKKDAALIPKLDWKSADREEIENGLRVSSDLMEELLRVRASSEKPGRWPILTFLCYCVAHEANHRAQVELALRLNGAEPDEMAFYEVWDWPKRARQLSGA